MNKVILIGRVGKNPEIKHFDNGQIANFNIATTSKWKTKEGEKKERVEWHNIVANGKLAETIEKYVTKGMLLSIIGEIRYRDYEVSGEKKYITEIVANSLEMLSKSDSVNVSDVKKPDATHSQESSDEFESDLPF